MARDENERRRFSGVVNESLDDPELRTGDLARLVYCSRSQFFRLFRALIEETPGAMRRRLLLERAAWRLGRTETAVTEIAFDAGYGSLEAFSRAFRKAFGISPSIYRRMGAAHFRLPAPNGFHFHSPSKGTQNQMDLFDIFNGHDSWHTRDLLQSAAALSEEQLDRPLEANINVFPWDTPDRSLRDVLERLVYTKEVWTAALAGGTTPPFDGRPAAARTPAALLERFDQTETSFERILSDVRNRGAWDDTFVDALCEPPETFTFGGTFAHIITFNSYRRLTAMDALRKLGVEVRGFGCPSEYEASVKKQG